MTLKNTLLGGLSPQAFLNTHWQKKPLLIRQAMQFEQPPLHADELAALAGDEDINARVVKTTYQGRPWHVDYGPFDEKYFASLPDKDWTLLVNDCEKHRPELLTLTQPFQFIPNWRTDDLMISYAAEGGSVGPHIDEYDVFLLQLDGIREWQIGDKVSQENYIDGLDLKILETFTPTKTWRLAAGDMLYLPPRVAHHGVAVDGTCMTASIGFRAPMVRALLETIVEEIISKTGDAELYQDPDLSLAEDPAEISTAVVEKMRALLKQKLDLDRPDFNTSVGRFLTESHTDYFSDEIPSIDIKTRWVEKSPIERNPFFRFASMQSTTSISLFVNGQNYELPNHFAADIKQLCNASQLSISDCQYGDQPEWIALLQTLFEEQALCFVDDK